MSFEHQVNKERKGKETRNLHQLQSRDEQYKRGNRLHQTQELDAQYLYHSLQ